MKFNYFAVLAIAMGFAVACSSMMGVGGPDVGGSIFGRVARSESIPGTIGSKEGKSCQSAVLALFASGDASVEGAAKAGGISRVSSVSFERTNVLGSVYLANCTLVTGE
ncbi:MAG: TRL-like family protein [bacterium]|nr:TRL-like family protein [bacterium]